MRFSFVSRNGDALPLVKRLIKEGHDVTFWGAKVDESISTTDVPYYGSDAVIIFDGPGRGTTADKLRRGGTAVLGASEFADSIQTVLGYAATLTDMAECRPFPTTYDLEAWFNGEDWIVGMTNVSVIDRRFLTGGLGVAVDFVGLTACFFKRYRPNCFKETLYRLSRFLKKVEYRGPIAIRNGKLECGFAATSAYTLSILYEGDLGKLLSEIAKGASKKIPSASTYAVGARVTLPPFPYAPSERDEIVSMVGPTISEARYKLNEKLRSTEYPSEVQYRTDIGVEAQRVLPNLLKEDVR